MGKKILIVFIAILCNMASANAEESDSNGFDNLGLWCYISVDLENDPVVDGYLRYTINTPNEKILGVQGPGSPHLFNNLGSTVELCLRKSMLRIDSEGLDSVSLDLVVDKFKDKWGNDVGSSDGIICYYQIVLNITR